MAVSELQRTVVKGLEVELTSDEIRQHLSGRAVYHTEKAVSYDGQVKSLQALRLDDDGGQSSYSNDPLHSMQLSASGHHKKAEYYDFLAAHIVADAIYRLQEHELERLEWFSRF